MFKLNTSFNVPRKLTLFIKILSACEFVVNGAQYAAVVTVAVVVVPLSGDAVLYNGPPEQAELKEKI